MTMKNIAKRFFPLPLFATVMFAATACVSEEVMLRDPEPTDGGDTEVLLRLRTPGSFAAPDDTRALTFAQENAVNDVWVLAVDEDDEIVVIEKGRNPDFDPNGDYDGPDEYDGSAGNTDIHSGSGTFAVVMPQSLFGETVKLVVLANAEDILEGVGYIQIVDGKFVPVAGVAVGNSYTDVRAELIGNLGEDQDGEIVNSIPMWGETQMTVSPSASPTVTLMRAVARLDVGLGTPSYDKTEEYPWSWDGEDADGDPIPFVLTGVEVNSRTNQYYLIPEQDADGDPILSQMDGTQTQTTYAGTGVITNGRYTTQNIYLPESGAVVNIANPTMDDADHNSRTYIIVKGKYNGGGETFYRLDFADEDENLLDVLRNHLYRFNITNVDGPGYTDIADARSSRPMNMTAELVEIDETASGHTVFDDEYYLSVDPVELTFDAVAGSQDLTLQTDYPGWTATVSANENGTGTAAWLTVGPNSGTDNGEAAQTLTVTAEANPSTTTVRTAWITVKAGRLSIKVKVTQERIPVPGVKAVHGVIGYIWNPGEPNHLQLTLDGDKDYFDGGPGELQSVQDQYTVYVANFKFGSLVATSSQNNGAFSSADVVAWPTQWAADRTAMEGEIGTVTGQTSWTNVPVSAALTAEATIGTDLPEGLGDPCDYWFGDHDGNGATATATENWRLPTAKENTVFVGGDPNNTTWQNWVPGNLVYSWASTTGTGSGTSWPYYYSAAGVATTTAGTFAAPASGRFPVAAQTGRAAFSESIPAAGIRLTNGSVVYQGSGGYYWSSTAYNGTVGYNLDFGPNVYPANSNNFGFGFSVRCVREPEMKGVPASPGVIGYKRNGTLTLRGSSAYAGTDVDPAVSGDNGFGPLENEPVMVAYFKYGSMIATGGETDDESDEFTAEDVVWAPADYSYSGRTGAEAIKARIGTSSGESAWDLIPDRTGNAALTDGWNTGATGSGLGDPCSIFTGDWVMPSGLPWNTESGSPFGTSGSDGDYDLWPAIGGNGPGADWIGEAEAEASGLPVIGAVGGKSATPGDHDWSMFLPVTGFRLGGYLYDKGVAGNYWSSAAIDNDTGSLLFFYEEVVSPGNGVLDYHAGAAVRCVPTVTP